MNELIKNPSIDILNELVSESQLDIKLCAPFIKKEIISDLLKYKNPKTKLTVITSSSIANYISKASDVEAIEMLLENQSTVFNYQNLHAKIYSFDSKRAIITSANLTFNGLYKNFEYGILLDDSNITSEINSDLESLTLSDFCGEFSKEIVDFIKDQISFYNDKNYKISYDKDGDFQIAMKDEYIISKLKSRDKELYMIINRKMSNSFSLNELYAYVDVLKRLHPKNNNVQAKIRQTLQHLRDKGIIKFVNPGNYKKIIK